MPFSGIKNKKNPLSRARLENKRTGRPDDNFFRYFLIFEGGVYDQKLKAMCFLPGTSKHRDMKESYEIDDFGDL